MYENLKQIATTYHAAKDNIQTEEATKNALIMPFIAALGFNVFNPLEVVPEITADIGDKRGEKIDYALKSGDKVLMLVECKKCTVPLTDKNVSQVFRYFGAIRIKMDVRVAILTNGLEYQFFSDLENGNVLDHVPFFTFDILNFDQQKVQDLQKFSKNQFDVDTIVAKAEELKRMAVVESILGKYMTSPTESFVKCVLSDINFEGMKTKDVVATYADIIKEAFSHMLKNRVESILKTAMKQDAVESLAEDADPEIPSLVKVEVETTQEEIECYAIVKSIARDIVSPSRIFLKATKLYCSVTLSDENNKQKLLLRFFFNNTARKKVALFTDIKKNKEMKKFPLSEIDDIYNYSDKIRATILAYESGDLASSGASSEETDAAEGEL
jgi:hypothetical protein